MTNTKNKFVRVSLIVFACILSAILLFMPFLIKDKRSVFADSTNAEYYSFSGSEILLGITARDIYNSGTNSYYTSNYSMLSFQIPFIARDSSNSNNFTFDFSGELFYVKRETHNFFTTFAYSRSFSFPLGTGNNFYTALKSSYNESNSVPYFYCWVYCDSTFNFNVQYVSLRSEWQDSNNVSYIFYIDYHDSNGSLLRFSFDGISIESQSITNRYPTGIQSISPLTLLTDPSNFSSRTYYFANAISNFSDNAYYQQGKDDGLQIGRAEGDSSGYDRGFREGKEIGKSIGYNEGTTDAGHYTFLGLIASAIDAPVQAFNGLFDFNLSFGQNATFNVKSFIIAMLTIALVIAFIRIIMAK